MADRWACRNGRLKSSESRAVEGATVPDPLRGSLMTQPFLGSPFPQPTFPNRSKPQCGAVKEGSGWVRERDGHQACCSYEKVQSFRDYVGRVSPPWWACMGAMKILFSSLCPAAFPVVERHQALTSWTTAQT